MPRSGAGDGACRALALPQRSGLLLRIHVPRYEGGSYMYNGSRLA